MNQDEPDSLFYGVTVAGVPFIVTLPEATFVIADIRISRCVTMCIGGG